MIRQLLLVLAVVFPVNAALAQFAGEDDAAYRAAKALWLSGEADLAAMKQFAELARQDNLAAQVMVGMITSAPSMAVRAVFWKLSREERWRITKDGEKIGAKRWRTIAAEREPLAALIFELKPKDRIAHAMALADLGRFRHALGFAYVEQNVTGKWGPMLSVATDPRFYRFTRYSLYPLLEDFGAAMKEYAPQSGGDLDAELVFELLERLPEPTFADRMLQSGLGARVSRDVLFADADRLRMRGAALLYHPELGPVADVIRDICPEDSAYHMGLLFYLQGSEDLLLDMQSELEPMVSTEEWRASGRFRDDLLRKWGTAGHRAENMGVEANCLTPAIAAAQE